MIELKSLIDEIEKCNSLFKKYSDIRVVAKELKISENSVKNYIKFTRLSKPIQNLIDISELEMLTPKENFSLLIEVCKTLYWDHGDISDEQFMDLYEKMKNNKIETKMRNQVHYKIGQQNIGRSCPKCNSSKHAIHSGDEINTLAINLALDVAFEIQMGEKPNHEPVPQWKCIDCGHEWVGDMTII